MFFHRAYPESQAVKGDAPLALLARCEFSGTQLGLAITLVKCFFHTVYKFPCY